MADEQVLISGLWRRSSAIGFYEKRSPMDRMQLGSFPISSWEEVDAGLTAGMAAFQVLQDVAPTRQALFLDSIADALEERGEDLATLAHEETALGVYPRLLHVEIPRTAFQLRLAASACRDRSWKMPTLSPAERIASYFAPIPGVVIILGPNNFPFAFNPCVGGDFAAAIATSHPVLAVSNPGHPATTAMLASIVEESRETAGLPAGTLQLVFGMDHEDGYRAVGDPRVAATTYTGSRESGLRLKAAADQAGRPIYLEMSSVNPIVISEGALVERSSEIAEELGASILLGAGQFCTSPGLLFVPQTHSGDVFVEELCCIVTGSESVALLDDRTARRLGQVQNVWIDAGASRIAKANWSDAWCRHPNSVFSVSAGQFVLEAQRLQTEAFGSVVLVVRYGERSELLAAVQALEGSLTGAIYTHKSRSEEDFAREVSLPMRSRVGRLLNDKAPTGVAVVPAMNHGGPFPSTGHPGFTAIGFPASLRRFGMLQSFDSVRPERLPIELRPDNPLGLQRYVDREWTDRPVNWG